MGDERSYIVNDRRLIDASDPKAVQYWASCIGVTPDQIRSAVAEVGREVGKVRDYLWEKGE